MNELWLLPAGLLVGAFGTLIGAGGGFLLVPLLLLMYPTERPEAITSMSLFAVFCNAASGTVAYARMGRIDYTAAAVFTLAGLPGAVLGAMTTKSIPAHIFDGLLGVVLIVSAIYVAFHRETDALPSVTDRASDRPRALWLGSAISAVVGFISSLLGIGGGIIHVPAMIRILKFPVHTATATSHFILACMALTATIVHVANGSMSEDWFRTAALAIGVIIGAQVGAQWSKRVHSRGILIGMSVALIFAGVRLVALSVGRIRL